MTCSLSIGYRLELSHSSLIVNTNSSGICICQTIIYNQKTTNTVSKLHTCET